MEMGPRRYADQGIQPKEPLKLDVAPPELEGVVTCHIGLPDLQGQRPDGWEYVQAQRASTM